MCDQTSPSIDLLRAKLIGDANEGVIYGNEEEVIALIDTGAMVSTISEGFNESMDSQPDLKDLSAQRLDLKAANGENIPHLGYIEAAISTPFVDGSVTMPV